MPAILTMAKKTDAKPSPQPFPSSPPWLRDTRLFVLALLLVALAIVIVFFRSIVVMLMMAVVVALIVRPLVDALDRRLPAPRWVVTLLIFLLLVGAILAVPLSALPGLARQAASLIANLPDQIVALIDAVSERLSQPISLLGGRYTIPVDELTVEAFQQYAQSIVGAIGPSLTSVSGWAGSLASITIGFISQTVLVLFIAFYLTKDGHIVTNYLLALTGNSYREDTRYLIWRINLIWGAFLRGQLMLMLVMGLIVFLVSAALGLPNPAVLGLLAGLMEIVPYAGPILAAIPGLLLAYFQSDASWLGALIGPFFFTLVVAGAYWLVQQLENYFVLPRILGHQLDLHPVIVVVGVLIGWEIAGIVGVFLASPILATLRLLLGYVYGKLSDRPIAFYDPVEISLVGHALEPRAPALAVERSVEAPVAEEPPAAGQSSTD